MLVEGGDLGSRRKAGCPNAGNLPPPVLPGGKVLHLRDAVQVGNLERDHDRRRVGDEKVLGRGDEVRAVGGGDDV